jgi:hypothetical protein
MRPGKLLPDAIPDSGPEQCANCERHLCYRECCVYPLNMNHVNHSDLCHQCRTDFGMWDDADHQHRYDYCACGTRKLRRKAG